MKVISTTKLPNELENKLITTYSEVTFEFHEDINRVTDIETADVILTYGEDLKADHINKAKQLKWIHVMSAGIEKMPFDIIDKRNILLSNARGIHKIPMAEYTISMLLNHYRRYDTFKKQQGNQVWNQTVRTREMRDSTLMVIGAGAIGEEVARLAKAFGMKTIAISSSGGERDHFDESYKQEAILEVLPKADFIVSILPSIEGTRPFYKTEHFSAMKDSTVFLNIGRGDVVEDDVLIEALNSRTIEHAILDVFNEEPLPHGHPFWKHDKITLTPHISGKSTKYADRAIEQFEENLSQFMKNQELRINIIDPNRGY